MAENDEKSLPTLAERAKKATKAANDLFAEAKGVWTEALTDSTDPSKALVYALRGHALEVGACTCILAAALYGVAHHYGVDMTPESLFDEILRPVKKPNEQAKEN